ncbi:hypothetical protein [Gallaecimonas mangrovi]|uniref:hypothetical protein n=1 Tax=Gallaecimonas mangrovi TaxID=2291597 RepID=UPI000E202D32|nr:hypothetical protein [Gallaecimonas mangrovi]
MSISQNRAIAEQMLATGKFYGSKDLKTEFGVSVERAATILGAIRRCKCYAVEVVGTPRHYLVKVLEIKGPTLTYGHADPELTPLQAARWQYVNTQVFGRAHG